MSRTITGIDHLIVGVDDLDAARATWSALGFTVTPRGSHVEWGTGNYCIMFQRDYVELLGVIDPAKYTAGLAEFLGSGEGMMGLAFGSIDADQTATNLRARGIEPDGPKDLKRNLELPEGAVQPAFKLLNYPPDTTPGLWSFVAQHLTPDMVRRPAWLEHANGARGIASVTIAVENPPAAADAYRTLFGPGAVVETDDVLTVRGGEHTLLFVAPDEVTLLHPEIRDEQLSRPGPVAVTLTVEDIGATRAWFEANAVRFRPLADGTLSVPATEANGVLLEFCQRGI
jgi:catechol 2,3-dioxygenase-like lactoylglutathione lyase family enzyme